MALVGHDDLQARSAYQPTIHHQGNRWIAYIGHHGGVKRNPLTGADEQNGTSVIDVTDPKKPRYLAHIPGEAGEGENGGAQMVRVCSGSTLPRADKSKVFLLRSFGNSGHEIWDVTDPAKPSRVLVLLEGLRQHAQELLGVRHRHRVRHLRPEGLAHAPDDEDLRPERSGQSEIHP